MMEDGGNEKLDDSNQNNLNRENKSVIDDEQVEVSTETENEEMIHMDIN